ncbi:alpha/beta fold hydrolase [Nucisporomicrobium flavum]|uniref:alpha/beta fold hydrolase n=1 Tax=Nucisporomicrobium flavum TaxID=2785915 RepID=UPI003C2EF1FC
MTTARLHDDAALDLTILGDGPAILLPVSTRVPDGEAAEQMRAWGADPALGRTLATALADAGLRVVAADYEGHLAAHPQHHTLTAAQVAQDLLTIADAAGAERFAYYGYSWLALAGLQLAIRTDRLTALAMGGFPPLGGPYEPMLTVTEATYRMALANRDDPPAPAADVQPGDWDATEVTLSPEQAGQYLTLYESLRGFDELAALDQVVVPRLAFAGENDNIQYGERWGNAYVGLADGLKQHRNELAARGWTVELVPGADHIAAMQARTVLPILVPWLTAHLARPAQE